MNRDDQLILINGFIGLYPIHSHHLPGLSWGFKSILSLFLSQQASADSDTGRLYQGNCSQGLQRFTSAL